jgi:hypothetical protein
VGLEFRPDPYEQIVDMLSFPSLCVEFLSALIALRGDYRLLHVEVVKVKVSLLEFHKVSKAP